MNSDQHTEPSFSAFWYEYPRKVGKQNARKAFDNALNRCSFGEIMEAIRNQTISGMIKGNDRFTPHAATWLNGDRWEDEIEQFSGISESTSNAARLIESLEHGKINTDSREPKRVDGRILEG